MARWLKIFLCSLLPVVALGSDFTRTGLVLHLDAGSLTGLANNAFLTSGWADQSGSGVVATGSTPPQFITDAGGGYPSVRFEGTGQFLQANVPTGGEATVFVVFSYRREAPVGLDAKGWDNFPYREILLSSSGTNPALSLASRQPYTPNPANTNFPHSPHYPSFNAKQTEGVTVQTWVDGRDTASVTGDIFNGRFYVGSATYQNLPAASSLFIGSSDASGSDAGKNDIREILVYNRALSDEERNAVQRYLGRKYDIELVWRPLTDAVEAWVHPLGSQQFGNQYSFGQSGIRVLDYARATLRQGNRVAKFRLSNRYATEDGFTAIAGIDTLTKLVRDHPEVKAVLDLPISDYLFWATTFANPTWQNAGNIDAVGLKPAVQQAIYQEFYDLVVYLLTAYSGTGKKFYLGNWEGDWMLATGYSDPTQIPQNRIQAMIDWANIRQKAVDDAKAATPHHKVQVWYYLEMNKADWMRDNLPCVANSVIPAMTKLDMISISSYTIHKDGANLAPTSRIYSDLNRVQALLAAKPNPAITGSRLIIGEYGWTYNATKYGGSLTEFAREHLNTARAFLGWQGGTLRFILQWQFFNNVDGSGTDVKEMSQIGPANEIRPMYHFHENFYRAMRRWVDDYVARTGTTPTGRAYADQAYHVLGTLSLARYNPTVTHTTYSSWRNRHFMDATEAATASISGPTADPYGSGISNLLRYGLSLGKFDAPQSRMPEVRYRNGAFVYAFPFDAKKTGLRWQVQATSTLTNWNLTVFDSATQSPLPPDGWIEVGAGSSIAPGAPTFYRLKLQLTSGN